MFHNRIKVPVYMQYDRRWGRTPMRGHCKRKNTISQQGCALASVAMLFTYYGARHTPESLNECMDWYACPFGWEQAPGLCGEEEVVFHERLEYSAEALQQAVQQDGFMPVLGLLKRSEEKEHWVLVVGLTADGDDYWVHDPNHDKAKPVLFSELTEIWRPVWMILYMDATPGDPNSAGVFGDKR